MSSALTNKIAIVTGASRGIGAAIAKRLAAEGAAVVVNYAGSKDAAEAVVAEIEAAGGTAEAFQADISDPAQVKALFDHVLDRHGRIDVLVNNAGITKDTLILTMRETDWQRILDVNLSGSFHCTKAALRPMLRARAGKIVNLASISAIRGGRGQANYAAAKGGIVSFTRATALEVAERGIQVNAVLPGFIETDMTKVIQRRAGDQVLERIPAGRFGKPEDVAGMVCFLCTEEADYVTGQAFSVDGGMSVA